MQILYTTPFKIIVGNSKIEIAVVLNCLFKNISKVTKNSYFDCCSKESHRYMQYANGNKNHQDVNDLLNIM